MDNNTFTVFTYGTLMHGFSGYNKYLKDSTFLGTGRIKGKIYQTNSGYPVVTMSKNGSDIYGELFEVDKDTMIKLRNYEGVYSFFTYYKEEIFPITLDDNSVKYARVFVAHPIAKPLIKLTAKKIKCGNWKEYISAPPKNYRKWALTLVLILINIIFLVEVFAHS